MRKVLLVWALIASGVLAGCSRSDSKPGATAVQRPATIRREARGPILDSDRDVGVWAVDGDVHDDIVKAACRGSGSHDDRELLLAHNRGCARLEAVRRAQGHDNADAGLTSAVGVLETQSVEGQTDLYDGAGSAFG